METVGLAVPKFAAIAPAIVFARFDHACARFPEDEGSRRAGGGGFGGSFGGSG